MLIETIIYCNTIGFVLLSMLLLSSREFANRKKRENKLFFRMVYITMGACVAEMLAFVFDGKTFAGARILVILFNTYLYVATSLYPILWILFVDWKMYYSEKRLRTINRIVLIPLCILFVLILLNLKYGFFFSVNADNIYSRGRFFWVALGMPYVYLLISVVITFFGTKYNRYLFFPVWLFLAPVFIAGIIQAVFYGVSIIWVAVALGIVTVYISQQNEVTYIDPLTGIYNRNYMSYILRKHESKKRECAGIMIDMDHFKTINDAYGHDVGDDAIVETANILKNIIPINAIVMRFAGDEFVIIIDTARIKELKDIMDAISKKVVEFNEENDKQYVLGLSMGYSFYWPNDTTIEEFVKEMDQQMYACKQERHLQEWKDEGRLI